MCILHQLIILPLSLQNVACVQTVCCTSISLVEKDVASNPYQGVWSVPADCSDRPLPNLSLLSSPGSS